MFAKVTTMKLAHKAVAATLMCGVFALGMTGVASAATGAVAAPAATTHLSCARAPKALTRISKIEGAIGRRLPKWQAAEKKATAAGHTTRAGRIETRIHKLQKIDTKVGTLAKKINAKCPVRTLGTGSTTAS